MCTLYFPKIQPKRKYWHDYRAIVFISDYVSSIKNVLFTTPMHVLDDILTNYKERVPKPLSSQFADKTDKTEATKKRKREKA